MRRSAPFLILLAAVLLVYSPALWNGFVWDDTALILRDPLIRSPYLLAEGFRHFLFLDATAADFYRPLQRLVYTCDYALAGFTPWVFHLTSLLVHAGAAMALYALGRQILAHEGTKARSSRKRDFFAFPSCLRAFVPSCENSSFCAFLVALLWAVHPIHSSAVAYISGLADPLAALFGFGGLALLLGGRRILAGCCLGAALFCKESGVFALGLGIPLAAALAWGEVDATRRQRFANFARVAVPALLIVGLYLGLRATAEHRHPPVVQPVPIATRPYLGMRAVAEYAGLLTAPVTLRMERDVRLTAGALQTVAGGLLLCGAALWFRRSDRTTRACLLGAGIAYLPVSNLFALNATVAEHWVYVPSAFLFLAAAASWERLPPLHRRLGLCLALFGCVWFAALCCRTALRCRDWLNNETFQQATIRDGGDSSRMLGNRALLELRRGNTEAALRDCREALARSPRQPFALLALAKAYIQQRDFAAAHRCLDRCENSPFVRIEALLQRDTLERQETGRTGVQWLQKAMQENPGFWPLRKQYIERLMEMGQIDVALRELRAVLSEQPFRAESWAMLGGLAETIGNPELAKTAYAEADRRDVWRGKAKSF